MAYAMLWRGALPKVKYLTRESGRRSRTNMLKKALAECDFVFKSTFMLTFPGEVVHGKSPEEQIDIATEKFAKLRLIIFKEMKAGRLKIKTFNYFLCWEFRPKTGDIHAHMLTDAYIPGRLMSKLLGRVGMGTYNYLQGINRDNPDSYRQAVKYAAKYVYKGGWDAVRGRRRYSMSKGVADSVNRWLKSNKRPFTGEIVSHEEVAVLNRDRHIVVVRGSGDEDMVAPGYYLYESPIRLDMAKVYRLEKFDPRYKRVPAKSRKAPDPEGIILS